MIASHDLDDQVRELAKAVRAASEEATAQERPFIMPWRLESDESRLRRLGESDDGCGCGPID